MMKKLSSCIDPFISFYASLIMKLIRSMMQQNFDIAVEDFSLSIHLSLYLDRYGFFAFLWSLKEEGGFPGRYWRDISKIMTKHWICTFGVPWWWTWSCRSVDTLLLRAHWGTPLRILSSSLDISELHIWRELDDGQTTVWSPVIYSQYADIHIT